MTTTTEITEYQAQLPSIPNARAGFETVAGFELIQRAAKVFATSPIVAKEFQGNISNCIIALDMALRMGANPLMVFQNLYIIHNRPAWSAQFLIATMNQSGRFSAIQYEFQGVQGADNWGCRAVATELATGQKLEGPLVTLAIAKKEGWFDKNGSKWRTMPELMLRYRAAAWFVRGYAPEIAMGLQTVEEVKDVYDVKETNGAYVVDSEPANPKRTARSEKKTLSSPVREKSTTNADFPPPPLTVPCPNRNNEAVDELECPGCPDRPSCPAYD